jgi:glyoxylase-like metal-dependent hydrolase (beta-lactamase superfamily II)
VNPITFALGGFPTEWLRVLERVDALDATTIVTGHGAALHDKALLHETMEVFRVLLREERPQLNDAFKVQLVDWYLHRVYEELDEPLSDAIATIPRS